VSLTAKNAKSAKGREVERSDALLRQYLSSLFASFALFAVKSIFRERESL